LDYLPSHLLVYQDVFMVTYTNLQNEFIKILNKGQDEEAVVRFIVDEHDFE